MKVKALIDILSQASNGDEDLEVILSSDAEGNDYHSIDGVDKYENTIVICPKHDSLVPDFLYEE